MPAVLQDPILGWDNITFVSLEWIVDHEIAYLLMAGTYLAEKYMMSGGCSLMTTLLYSRKILPRSSGIVTCSRPTNIRDRWTTCRILMGRGEFVTSDLFY
jgi:hypothetical protein